MKSTEIFRQCEYNAIQNRPLYNVTCAFHDSRHFFRMLYYLVDAFTNEPFKGNPAGVCIVDDYPPSFEMQKLSTYHNWSEIAFVKHLTENRFYIRWFSPADEAPLCGHATLAAAHILFSRRMAPLNSIIFEYNSGIIGAVLNSDEFITLSFAVKPVYKCNNPPFSTKAILGIEKYVEILKDDLIYVIVLNSADDIIRAMPNFDAIKEIESRAIAITSAGNGDFDFSSRYFAPRVGIYEDPVCGSMHCRLAYYWKSILGKSKFRAFQASRRTGTLNIEIVEDIVKITGSAVTIGTFKNYHTKYPAPLFTHSAHL